LDERVGWHLGEYTGDARTLIGKQPLQRGAVVDVDHGDVVAGRR
jgi:hypothetical protein